MASWDLFFKEKIGKIFADKKTIIDIGGGLRVIKEKNNRYDKSREWIRPLIKKTDYKILDPVPDYNPDIVGDIHNLPFQDNSVDAIICIAVLEHVENPILACKEMHRVLRPGGYCFIYVPFLFYYHAEKGYYGDYWRFTPDSIGFMCRKFAKLETSAVRGALETWIHLSPLGRLSVTLLFARLIDRITGKTKSHQVSGYNVFLVK